jgi:hypothetical protein
MEEVEDAVSARIESGDEVRPRDRRLRRRRRAEHVEPALVHELREVARLCRMPGDHVAQHVRVESVDAEEDDARILRRSTKESSVRRASRDADRGEQEHREQAQRGVDRPARKPHARVSACAGFRALRAAHGGLGEQRAALHVVRHVDAEEIENRRREIDERRIGELERAIAPEHAGHEPRIDAVIAGPALRVVGEHFAAHGSRRAIPRVAEALVVADEQLGRGVGVRTLVHLAREEHFADHRLVGRGIAQRLELSP